MTEHFKKRGDGYDLSPAAVLLVISDTLRQPDTTAAVKERALRTIGQVMAVARGVKFESATTLETMLVFGGEPARMLPLCDALVKHVGDWAILAIVRRVMGERSAGGAR